MQEKLWKIQQLMDYIGINQKTAYRFIKNNGLPAMKINKVYYFRKSQIDDWLSKQSINPLK